MGKAKITKDQVLSKLLTVQSAIEKIKEKEKFVFKTIHKFVPGAGKVHEITSIKDLVIAHSKVNAEITNLNTSAQELGVTLDKSSYEFLGFPLNVWEEEIKARLQELQDASQLKKLKAAEKVLSANLSDDDKFNYEMLSIGIDLNNL